jgi:hypothetical protein
VGEIRTLERAFNTMAGSLGDARAELADSRAQIIRSADETRRFERDDHNPQPEGQGTTVRVELLGRVPREPAYRLQWSSRPVVTAEIPLCAPHSGLVSRWTLAGLTG